MKKKRTCGGHWVSSFKITAWHLLDKFLDFLDLINLRNNEAYTINFKFWCTKTRRQLRRKRDFEVRIVEKRLQREVRTSEILRLTSQQCQCIWFPTWWVSKTTSRQGIGKETPRLTNHWSWGSWRFFFKQVVVTLVMGVILTLGRSEHPWKFWPKRRQYWACSCHWRYQYGCFQK